MSKLTAGTALFCLSLFLLSCQKEVSEDQLSGNNNSLLGNYKFIALESNSVVTQQISDGTEVEKTVSYSNYVTKNNTGTISIEAANITAKDLSYSVETSVKGYSYFNNILEDSLDIPFSFTVPPTTSSAPYKLVGQDSIYFSSGSMLISNSPQQQTAPSGAKLKMEGNNLLIINNIANTVTQNLQGLTLTATTQGKVTITLQKQ